MSGVPMVPTEGIVLTRRVTATVLAALRLWQGALQKPDAIPPALLDVANDGGTVKPLSDSDVDSLCQRLNRASQ